MRVLRALHSEKGVGLLETLVAVTIMGITALAFLSGLATETKATTITDEQTTAEALARSEMEYARHYDYTIGATQYPVDPLLSIPTTWTVSPCSVQPAHDTDDGLQKLTVSVEHNGRTVFILQGFKRQ